MADADDPVPIVIDNGSEEIKGGFAGDDASSIMGCPTVVTCARTGTKDPQDVIVGDARWTERRGNLVVKYPMDRGIITNWDHMEKLWQHTFCNNLRVPSDQHPVLLTECPLNPKANRERMVQMMFDVFGVPSVFVSTQAVLSLYASGRTTGCVLDVGHGVTHAVPIYEGFSLPHAIIKMDLAGKDLDDYMRNILMERELDPSRYTSDSEIVSDMKKSMCFVSLDFDQDMEKAAESSILEKDFEMPNGELIHLGNERFRCPEALFRPELMGLEDMDGIATSTFRAITKCDAEIQTDLFANIVLAGGSTLFPGIKERMAQEVAKLVASSFEVQVVAPADRQNSAWAGGSIVASLPAFQHMWVSKKDYEDSGPSIIHSKCF